jgi:Icc protein
LRTAVHDHAALDELRADRLVNRDDLSRRWPTLPREAADVEGRTRLRLQLLRDLNDQVKLLGLDLGGEMPPQGGGPPR